MVLLHLISQAGLKLPVIFHRESFMPKKYTFANRVIEANGYETHDWPPMGMQVTQNGEHFEIVNRHQVSANGADYLPIGIVETREGEFLCGLKDLYLKPTGSFIFPWDLVFIGHKSSDVDPIMGNVEFDQDVVRGDGSDARPHTLAFPLRHFTDHDIWAYTDHYRIPVNTKRYVDRDRIEQKNDSNPDYFPACTACMRLDGPPEVHCPKQGKMIESAVSLLHWVNARSEASYLTDPKEVVNGVR